MAGKNEKSASAQREAKETDPTMNKAENAKKSGTVAGTSTFMNSVLLYATLLGLGIIGGYVVFYTVYNHRCSDLLDEAEGRHNVTKADLETRYKSAIEEHHECLNDESVMLELYELRGRVETLETLEKKQQVMKEAHDEMSAKLLGLEDAHKAKVDAYNKLQMDFDHKVSQLSDLQKLLGVCNQEKEKLTNEMGNQGANTKEFRALQRNFEDCRTRLENAILNDQRKKRRHNDGEL